MAAFEAHGPKCFVSAVRRFERELTDAGENLVAAFANHIPIVRYAPRVLTREHPDGAMARADGLFAIDGSDYEYFRWVFLHEIGHHVCRGLNRWASEDKANRFARTMARRLARSRTNRLRVLESIESRRLTRTRVLTSRAVRSKEGSDQAAR